MPTWLKVVLIVVAVIALLIAAGGFLAYRWVMVHAEELRVEGRQIKAEAAELGRGKEPAACVDEAFARLQRCGSLMCEVKTRVFLTNCVAAADVPPGFCAAIPPHHEIMATARWAVAECARRGHAGDQRCTRMITALQDYCEHR